MATKKTSKTAASATKKKEAPKAAKSAVKSVAEKKAPKAEKKTEVKKAAPKAVASKKITKGSDKTIDAKSKTAKLVKTKSAPDKKSPAKSSAKPTAKVQEKKSAPAKEKTTETAKKQVQDNKNKALKISVAKDNEKASSKKNVKKAPNQSLETILPQDKVEVKPKVLAKPPIKRVIAAKPAAVNIKKQEAEKTHYSQSELEEFRVIINKKLDEARRDFDLLKESLSNKDNGTEDTSPTFKLLEDGSDVLSKEELAQLAARQQKFITNLEHALIRIQNKTYGVCRITGKLISADRLRIVPHATTSIEGKLTQ